MTRYSVFFYFPGIYIPNLLLLSCAQNSDTFDGTYIEQVHSVPLDYTPRHHAEVYKLWRNIMR